MMRCSAVLLICLASCTQKQLPVGSEPEEQDEGRQHSSASLNGVPFYDREGAVERIEHVDSNGTIRAIDYYDQDGHVVEREEFTD